MQSIIGPSNLQQHLQGGSRCGGGGRHKTGERAWWGRAWWSHWALSGPTLTSMKRFLTCWRVPRILISLILNYWIIWIFFELCSTSEKKTEKSVPILNFKYKFLRNNKFIAILDPVFYLLSCLLSYHRLCLTLSLIFIPGQRKKPLCF